MYVCVCVFWYLRMCVFPHHHHHHHIRFKVPKGGVPEREFLECIDYRRTLMEKHKGFIAADVENPTDELWVYTTRWVEKVLRERERERERFTDTLTVCVCVCVCVSQGVKMEIASRMLTSILQRDCVRVHMCVCAFARLTEVVRWVGIQIIVCVCVCVYQVNWEEYMWSKEATLSQMPVGIWQYPQDMKKGIGEPYVPILRLEDLPK